MTNLSSFLKKVFIFARVSMNDLKVSWFQYYFDIGSRLNYSSQMSYLLALDTLLFCKSNVRRSSKLFFFDLEA